MLLGKKFPKIMMQEQSFKNQIIFLIHKEK